MWPTRSTSKHPLANATELPRARSLASASANASSSRMGAFIGGYWLLVAGCWLLARRGQQPGTSNQQLIIQFLVPLDRVAHLVVRRDGGPHLHHYDPPRVIRQLRRLGVRRAGRQREGEGGDDGVAGAGDVRDLVGAVHGDVHRLTAIALEQ